MPSGTKKASEMEVTIFILSDCFILIFLTSTIWQRYNNNTNNNNNSNNNNNYNNNNNNKPVLNIGNQSNQSILFIINASFLGRFFPSMPYISIKMEILFHNWHYNQERTTVSPYLLWLLSLCPVSLEGKAPWEAEWSVELERTKTRTRRLRMTSMNKHILLYK